MRIKNTDKVVSILISAAIHANNVMTRKHVVPERRIRVGEFITCIRREIAGLFVGAEGKNLLDKLTDKHTWSDILELKAEKSRPWQSSCVSNLDHIVELAKMQIDSNNPKVIELSLNQLDNTLDEAQTFIDRLQENNEETGEVLEEFYTLINNMSDVV